MFIVIEGTDGSGKTTIAKRLVAEFEKGNEKVVHTRELGGCGLSEKIRRLVIENRDNDCNTDLMLAFAARNEHVTKVILPHLLADHVVISERFADSTFAYQVRGSGADEDLFHHLEAQISKILPPPLTIYLSIDPKLAHERMSLRNVELDKFEENDELLEDIDDAYNERIYADRERFIIIDASQTIEEMMAQIIPAVSARRDACTYGAFCKEEAKKYNIIG